MKKTRTHSRSCFAGSLHRGVLRTRGCKTTITNHEGDFLRDVWDQNKSAWLNLGDRVIVSNGNLDIDEVAMAEVVGMGRDGTPTIATKIGCVSDGPVHVMKVSAR